MDEVFFCIQSRTLVSLIFSIQFVKSIFFQIFVIQMLQYWLAFTWICWITWTFRPFRWNPIKVPVWMNGKTEKAHNKYSRHCKQPTPTCVCKNFSNQSYNKPIYCLLSVHPINVTTASASTQTKIIVSLGLAEILRLLPPPLKLPIKMYTTLWKNPLTFSRHFYFDHVLTFIRHETSSDALFTYIKTTFMINIPKKYWD